MQRLIIAIVSVSLLAGCHKEGDDPKSVEQKSGSMKISRQQLIGGWSSTKPEREFVLKDDGSAETCLGGTERYRGTWRFSPPHQLLVRAVIPLHDPEIDDELNAYEMCFEIRDFTVDRFTADEFDEEGLRNFRRK